MLHQQKRTVLGYLLGVVGAILGVDFKVFTLRKHKSDKLGFSF